MKKSQTSRTGYLRIAHEFLFALNLGLVARWAMAQAGSYSELTLQLWINRHLHPHSNVGGNIAFFVLALEVALSVFLLLRILSIFPWLKRFLSMVGIVSLVALPSAWLYATRLREPFPGMPNAPRTWLYLELLATILIATVYLLAKWPFPEWNSIALLILHFGLWAWLFPVGNYFWLAPFDLVFPLAGLCSSLAWGLYISAQRRSPVDKSIASA